MAQCSRSVVVAWLVAALVPVWAPDRAFGQAIETVKVTATPAAERVITLPGELLPFQATAVTARISGFIDVVHVDRGSVVRAGQALATLSAPELVAQMAEAQARVRQEEARTAEADERFAVARSLYTGLLQAAQTPGAVATIELTRAREGLVAAEAAVAAQAQAVAGAKSAHEAIRVLEQYQRVTAPFAGRIVERLVHPGALVGPSAGALFRLEETARLRLVVPVPEASLGVVTTGRTLEFTVPSQAGRTFTARLARSAGSLDGRTRSMMVEADVVNRDGALAPGMFPDVRWPIVRAAAGLMVPTTAVVTTTERTFVIRVAAGKAEWVTVKKGAVTGDQVEVAGALAVGDTIVRRGTDEIRAGASIK